MLKLQEGPKGFIDRIKAGSHVLERVSDICRHCGEAGEAYYVTLFDDGSLVSAHGLCYRCYLICQAAMWGTSYIAPVKREN